MKPFLALLSCCLLLSCAGASQAAETSRPNIVVMLVDDMGVMDTSVPFLTDAQGNAKRYPLNDYYRTPNMERLAAAGVRLNHFYAMSVCSPTRISIMTGQNAARHHTTNWINPDQNNGGPQGPTDWNWKGLTSDDVTLPKLLRSSGYRTIHVGKGHFAPREFEAANPQSIGFDVNVGGASIGAPGSYYGVQDFGAKPKNAALKKNNARANNEPRKENAVQSVQKNHAVPGLEKYHGNEFFLTEALTIEAKKHLSDSVRDDKPFFLYFAQYAVHGPFDSDPRFAANYKDSGKPAPAQAFATLVEGMDKSLGDVLDHLESLGVAENTLVILLGDNGSDAPLGHPHEVACAAPLRGKKGSHYEGGMRVPFIAAWAKANSNNAHQTRTPLAAGSIQTQQAAVQDLFPTLLDVAVIPHPTAHPIDGIKLQTLFTAKPDPSRSETFLMHYPHAPHRTDYFTVFRDGDWKLVYHYFPTKVSDGSHYQLFYLKDDPFEQNDIAKTHPAYLKRMMQGMVESLKAHDALYPIDQNGKQVSPKMPE
jgi:arylsulfatase A-like enzyme